MDKIVEKLVGLGVPGLVLLVAVSTSGLSGGAAIVTALSTLGGPFGMMGGLTVLGGLTLIGDAIGEYGVELIFKEVLKGLKQRGIKQVDIREAIDSYPITEDLKAKLNVFLNMMK